MRGHAFRPFGGDSVAVLAGEEHRRTADCFADDVIIDFPSVAPAIDRIRRAFLVGEHATPLDAAIRLTAHEARAGVTVPLQVPVRCTCRRCGGRGETWTEPCGQCAGTGSELFPHRVQITVPAGVHHGARFQFTVTARHHSPTPIELHVYLA